MKKDTIGIVGNGIIASAFAVLTTTHGYSTHVKVRSDASAEKLRKTVDGHYALLISQGIAGEAQIDCCRSYLHITKDYADLAVCDVIFEAVVEYVDVKQEVYRAIADTCPNVRWIGSCSSAKTPEMLTEGLGKYEDRVIITHPFNPVHMAPYCELCGCEKTAPGLLEDAAALLRALDRQPVILKKSTPGFIGNRLQFALFREAMQLIEDGVCDAKDIDTALNYSFCPRYTSIGLFEHMDYAGIELDAVNCELLFPVLSDQKQVPDIMKALLEEGKLGTRSGEGFYDWRDVDMQQYAARVNAPYWRFFSWDLPEENDAT